MKNKNIKDEVAYFKKVVKNMDNKDFVKNNCIGEFEVLFGEFEILAFGNTDTYNFQENSLLRWIDLIENDDLYNAIIKLTIEGQILLSYIFGEDKTQVEAGKTQKITTPEINKKLANITNKIKSDLCKR